MSCTAFSMQHEGRTLPCRRLMEERFIIITVLGRGSFGEVLLVEDRYASGTLLVVKRARMTSAVLGADDHVKMLELHRLTKSEARIMSLFNDEGIVRLLYVWHEEIDNSVCLLMEYCAGGDLERFVRDSYPLPEGMLRLIFLQCLLALAQIHAKSVVHRDMKLSNILVSGCRSDNAAPVLKIADFGLSVVWSESASLAAPPICVGTPLYMSPETAVDGQCGFGSDVWSIGVVFYRLMTRAAPFVGGSFADLRRQITTASPPHPSRLAAAPYSQPLGDLVLSMLAKPPAARPTARELLASPLFAAALPCGAWRPRALRGAVALFACQPDHRLRILAQPRCGAKVVAEIGVGDHVLVAHEAFAEAADPAKRSKSGAWIRVLAPRGGFCATHLNGCPVLQYVGDPRPPALLSPTESEGIAAHSVSRVETSTLPPPPTTNEGPQSHPTEEVQSKPRESPAKKLLRLIFG